MGLFCSSRAPTVNDEPVSDSMQSLTTTEASSDDVLIAANQVNRKLM